MKKSKYRGVSWARNRRRWRGQLSLSRFVVMDRYFGTELAAHRALNKMRRALGIQP